MSTQPSVISTSSSASNYSNSSQPAPSINPAPFKVTSTSSSSSSTVIGVFTSSISSSNSSSSSSSSSAPPAPYTYSFSTPSSSSSSSSSSAPPAPYTYSFSSSCSSSSSSSSSSSHILSCSFDPEQEEPDFKAGVPITSQSYSWGGHKDISEEYKCFEELKLLQTRERELQLESNALKSEIKIIETEKNKQTNKEKNGNKLLKTIQEYRSGKATEKDYYKAKDSYNCVNPVNQVQTLASSSISIAPSTIPEEVLSNLENEVEREINAIPSQIQEKTTEIDKLKLQQQQIEKDLLATRAELSKIEIKSGTSSNKKPTDLSTIQNRINAIETEIKGLKKGSKSIEKKTKELEQLRRDEILEQNRIKKREIHNQLIQTATDPNSTCRMRAHHAYLFFSEAFDQKILIDPSANSPTIHFPLFNINHVKFPQDSGGWHMLPSSVSEIQLGKTEEIAGRSLTYLAEGTNGVFLAKYTRPPKEDKVSTFFPIGTTCCNLPERIKSINHFAYPPRGSGTICIGKTERVTPIGTETSYYELTYNANQNKSIPALRSVYPLLSVIDCTNKQPNENNFVLQLQNTAISYSTKELLDLVKTKISNGNAIIYTTTDPSQPKKNMIDIADVITLDPSVPESQYIKQGIYVIYDESQLNS